MLNSFLAWKVISKIAIFLPLDHPRALFFHFVVVVVCLFFKHAGVWLVKDRGNKPSKERVCKRPACLRKTESLEWTSHSCEWPVFFGLVPTGLPSRCGDVAVYVFDINQPRVPTPFYSVLVSVSVLVGLSTVFFSKNSLDSSPLSHCSSGLISALLVLSTIYLFTKVSLSPDIILCG